jgi:hypothetical protein
VFCNTLVYGDLAQMLNEMPGSLFSMEFTRNHCFLAWVLFLLHRKLVPSLAYIGLAHLWCFILARDHSPKAIDFSVLLYNLYTNYVLEFRE